MSSIAPAGNRMNFEIARQARLAQDVARAQVQISTGKRLQDASDDPVAAARVAQLKQDASDNDAWTANVGLAKSLSSDADTALGSMSDRLVQAREWMVAASSGTASAADRQTYAQSLRDAADELDQLAASKSSLGQPLFAAGQTLRVGPGQTLTPVITLAGLAVNGNSPAAVLRQAADAVANGDSAGMASALDQISSATSAVADVHGAQGLIGARIDRLANSMATTATAREAERSNLEDTDIASAVATLNGKQLTLEAAQAAFARINRRTLFDILS